MKGCEIDEQTKLTGLRKTVPLKLLGDKTDKERTANWEELTASFNWMESGLMPGTNNLIVGRYKGLVVGIIGDLEFLHWIWTQQLHER
eukprot:1380273-Amphidinium_carterae.1